MKALSLEDPSLYVNRELSLLAFQRRVLEEAQDERTPLLERLKFIAIVSSNLNEFFMVRVAGVLDQVAAGVKDPNEPAPGELFLEIRAQALGILVELRRCLLEDILPPLEQEGVSVSTYADLTPEEKQTADEYFRDIVFPVLTPLASDPGRPFPHISNLSLNLAIVIRKREGDSHFARVKVPDTLPALLDLTRIEDDSEPSRHRFVWLEQVVAANLQHLFPGAEVVESHPFHVTRDADMEIQELEAEDLLETIEEGVRKRRFGSVVRLAVDDAMPVRILRILMSKFEIGEREVFRLQGPLALNRLMSLYGSLVRPALRETPIVPRTPRVLEGVETDEDFFGAIRSEDILLHHPYDSFQPVVDFLRRAARDPKVLAIKMTLYRVGRNSPVVEALLEAMENGKQVAVLVELKARFDEESNIEWARALEHVGVHVVYGLVGLKIHSKVALVVRREDDRIRRYVHLSTGNYNAVTALLYTDIGMLTCDEAIGADASDLFNYLTGYVEDHRYRKLLVAPVALRERLAEMIRREIKLHKQGRQGRLIFKTNGLVDKRLIRLLYEASQAGVQVDLLVRGICCLRPDVPGVSDNIRVVSIVGRFLEHSRIYYFRNGGDEEMYMGSADLMPRNLSFRVESVFPVGDPQHLRYLRDDVLGVYLADNTMSRLMLSDGSYRRESPAPGEPRIHSQSALARRSGLHTDEE